MTEAPDEPAWAGPALQGNNASYIATITPEASGTVTVDPATGAAQDSSERRTTPRWRSAGTARSGVGPRNQRAPLPAGLDGRVDAKRNIGVRDVRPDQFHDPEFRTLVLAARAVIAERVHRGVATPPEQLAVAALDEMPDEEDPAAVRVGRPRPRSGMRCARWCSRRWSSTSASLRRSPTKPTATTATTATATATATTATTMH